MTPEGPAPFPKTLLAIPAFGSPELTDAVLGDLVRDGSDRRPDVRIVVVDNGGDYVLPFADSGVVGVPHREQPALDRVGELGAAGRSRRRLPASAWCSTTTSGCPGVFSTRWSRPSRSRDIAVVAACYDDFWLHQRAQVDPGTAVRVPAPAPSCGTCRSVTGPRSRFAAPTVLDLGGLDTVAFPRHGYGSDIDLALRIRAAGLRCVVTESAYV